jgi:hypothetical protein
MVKTTWSFTMVNAPNEAWNVELMRDGTDGADTYGDSMDLALMRFRVWN